MELSEEGLTVSEDVARGAPSLPPVEIKTEPARACYALLYAPFDEEERRSKLHPSSVDAVRRSAPLPVPQAPAPMRVVVKPVTATA